MPLVEMAISVAGTGIIVDIDGFLICTSRTFWGFSFFQRHQLAAGSAGINFPFEGDV